MFSYITTESGFTHQIRTDCRLSSTENGQTAAGKPQLETAARESVFPRFATLHSEKQIRYCVYFRFRGFFDCTYLDISSWKILLCCEANPNSVRAMPHILLNSLWPGVIKFRFYCSKIRDFKVYTKICAKLKTSKNFFFKVLLFCLLAILFYPLT